MQRTTPSVFTYLIREVQPWFLLLGILFYVLGGGIADYLGHMIDWTAFWLGMATIILLQASSFWLNSYYERIIKPVSPAKNGDNDERDLSRIFLQASVTTLTIGAVITVLMISHGIMHMASWVLLGIAFFLAFFYAVPPLRLAASGYGELVQAFMVVNLIPGLSFVFQMGELHRLVTMLTFSLTALFLAMELALELESYTADLLIDRMTLLQRIGWQRGILLHNLLIMCAYLVLGLAALLGLPRSLVVPGLYTLPLGILQVVLMIQISNGGKPRWKLLTVNAMALVGVTAYLITLALWTV
jgi:1,4-dihydroxy-2-naphthoate octaprenyltransferase